MGIPEDFDQDQLRIHREKRVRQGQQSRKLTINQMESLGAAGNKHLLFTPLSRCSLLFCLLFINGRMNLD